MTCDCRRQPYAINLTDEIVELAKRRLEAKATAGYVKDRAVTDKANYLETEVAEVAVALTWYDESALSRVFKNGEKVKRQPFDITTPQGRGFGVRWTATPWLFFHTKENGYAHNPDDEWLPEVMVTGKVEHGVMRLEGWATLHEAMFKEDLPRAAYVVHKRELHAFPIWDLHGIWVERDYPRSAWDPDY